MAKKRKRDSIDFHKACPPVASRIRRSQVTEFDFKKQCLFCAEECNPVNCRHPETITCSSSQFIKLI